MAYTSSDALLDEEWMAKIVHKILDKDTEQALTELSDLYIIRPPEIVVGTIKGKRKTVYAVYVPNENRIYAMNSDIFYNPFVGTARVLSSSEISKWQAPWIREEC